MLDSLLRLKKEHKTILLATGTKYSSDVVFAALSMYSALRANGYDVHLQNSRLLSSKIWKQRLSAQENMNVNELPPSRYTFKLPSGFKLNDISWENDKDQVLVKIDAQAFSKELPPLKIKSSPIAPNLIIYIGTNSGLTELESELKPEKKKKIEKLLVLPKKITFNDDEISFDEEIKSFSFKAFNIIKELKLDLNKQTATLLLAGHIVHTEAFKKNISTKMFSIVKELLTDGADYQEAYELGVRDLNLRKLHFIAELMRTTIMVAPGVYQAGLILNRPLKMRLEVQEIMQIANIYDCDLALVSLSSPVMNKTYIRVNGDRYDLKKLLKTMKGKGNKAQGMIESRGDITQVHAQIYKELGIWGDGNVQEGT